MSSGDSQKELQDVRLLEIVSSGVIEIRPDASLRAMGYLIRSRREGRPVKVILPSEYAMRDSQVLHLAAGLRTKLYIYRNTGAELLDFDDSSKVLEFRVIEDQQGNRIWDCDGFELQEDGE